MAPKRKRTAAQASTHDGPDEPTDDNAAEPKSMDPPTKRTRSTRSQSNAQPADDASSMHTSSRPNTAQMPANAFEAGGGENGEAGQMRMEAPPPAGSVDPEGGYTTNKPPTGRPVRVYADGVFDLFHLGHMRQLQQAKTAFPDVWLIVGVTGEAETHKRKGLTVMSAKQRAESLRHCRWVDEVIEDCPWVITVEFLEKHSIDYVAHDDIPYGASEGDDIYKPIKEKGMFLVTQRTEGVSTTGIITKIVRDYEQYISRQLRRGTSRQELNISWLKKNELDIKRHVSELRDTIRTNWTTTGQELGRDLKQFWQPSRPSSPAPSHRNGIASSANGLTATPSSSSSASRLKSPFGSGRGKNTDFAAGYAMGLIGGVKAWMEGSKRRTLSDSRPHSPGREDEEEDEESSESSPPNGEAESDGLRGRSKEVADAMVG